MSPVALIAAIALLASSETAPAADAGAKAGRFLYLVACDATVERFDAVERVRTGTFDLPKRPGATRLFPKVTGVLEVCEANQVVFDPAASAFYTLVPRATAGDLSGNRYRIVGFSVPDLRVTKVIAVPGKPAHPPTLALTRGRPRATPAAESASEWDLSVYPGRAQRPNRVIETSGARALLHVYAGPAEVMVADATTKTLFPVAVPGPVVDDTLHLSPGGTHVVVEGGTFRERTGDLSVFDVATGQRVKTVSRPDVASMSFRGIAPAGGVLYTRMEEFTFVELGLEFPARPVSRRVVQDFPPPTMFFADR